MLKLGDKLEYKGQTLEVVIDTDRLLGGWGRCSTCFAAMKTTMDFCFPMVGAFTNSNGIFHCPLFDIPAVIKPYK